MVNQCSFFQVLDLFVLSIQINEGRSSLHYTMQVNSSNLKNIDYNKGYPAYRIYCRTVGLK